MKRIIYEFLNTLQYLASNLNTVAYFLFRKPGSVRASASEREQNANKFFFSDNIMMHVPRSYHPYFSPIIGNSAVLSHSAKRAGGVTSVCG